MNLIDRSKKILGESEIEDVWRAGIHRDPSRYHITVMYPPLKAMNEIDEEAIFLNYQHRSNECTLYIHIPFCSGKCTFCYFYQIEKPQHDLINRYLSALKKEIAIVEAKTRNSSGPLIVKSIFFGGGSPTMLSVDHFEDLINTLKQKFQLADNIEITVEIHPEIARGKGAPILESYLSNSVNRLNIGVQSFNDGILKLTNRRHTSQDAVKTFHLARSAGFENINIDLLYPLPDLTPDVWEETLNTAFNLDPESVTTYFTAFRESSPIHKLFLKSPQRFPDEMLNHLFRIMSMEKAKEKGYKSNELIDWFVKPREGFHYEHQKNEAVRSEDVQLLSFGSGVFTYVNYHQYYNHPDIHKYCDMIEAGKLPVWRGVRLSEKERFSRAMVLGIKSGSVNLERIEEIFKEDVYEHYGPVVQNLESLGLLERVNGVIKLSKKGILFADEIAVQFISSDVRQKLEEQSSSYSPETDILNTYNFMYDMAGFNFM